MPVITFDGPDGPERHELPYGPNGFPRLMLAEIREIQRVTGMTAVDWWNAIADASPDGVALAALVQALWKRQGRIVRFDAVDFDYSTLDLDLLPEEAAKREESAEGAADAEDPTETPSGPPPTEG